MTVQAPQRPVLRWFGGKWRIAPKIIDLLPPHATYVEPYGGAASVLLRKSRADHEIYNDLDVEVVNLFRVLQDPARTERLRGLLSVTPFARAEFEKAYIPARDPVERARKLLIRSFMGVGSDSATRLGRSGFRRAVYSEWRAGSPAKAWGGLAGILASVVERFRGVVIENRPALDVMSFFDGADTLHYVDPPYLSSERTEPGRKNYRHELSDADHLDLLSFLQTLRGMVVLSGYPSSVYDRTLGPGWRRVQLAARADRAAIRTEVVWVNEACALARGGVLF